MDKTLRFILFTILLVASFSVLKAQELVYKKYSVQEGLMSNDIYDVAQDTLGYIWIASELGLQKYDGLNFHTINTDTLQNVSVVRLQLDHHGTLWCATIDNQLAAIKNDQLLPHPMNADIQQYSYGAPHSIVFDEEDKIWMSNVHNTGELEIDSSCVQRESEGGFGEGKKDALFCKFRKVKNRYTFNKCYCDSSFQNIGQTQIDFTDSSLFLVTNKFANYVRYSEIIQIGVNDYVIAFGSKLIVVQDERIVKDFEPVPGKEIINLFVDHKQRIWLSYYNDGLFVYQDFSCEDFNRFLIDQTVSKIYQDRIGDYWFATLGGGLLQCESIEVLHSELDIEDKILDLVYIHDTIHLLTSSGYHYIWKDNLHKDVKEASGNAFFSNLYYDHNRFFILGKGLSLVHGDKVVKELKDGTIRDISKIDLNRYLCLRSNSGFSVVDENLNYLSEDYKMNNLRLNHIVYYNENVFVGGKDGLYNYDFKGDRSLVRVFSEKINSKILHLVSSNDRLWVVTADQKLYVIKEDKLIVENEIPLPNHVNDILIASDSTVYIASQNSVFELLIGESGATVVNTYFNFTNKKHIDFEHLFLKNKQLCAVGDNAIYCRDITIEANEFIPPLIHLISVAVDGGANVQQHDKLAYDANNVSFNFISPTYNNIDQLQYHFKVDAVDDAYKISSQPNCTYYNLPAGKHTFRVKVMNADGVFSTEEIFEFTIRRHFARTWWFITSLVIVVLIISFVVFRRWLRRRRILETQERELFKVELKAIRSQMNPHFIFNSMNSIQNLVLSQDTEEAYEYLSKFSLLMRWTLNYSRKHQITLKEEINFLETYIELEHFRFKGKFDYTVEVDDDLDIGFVQIPPFLLQPMIENAIIHGLTPKESAGLLVVRFKLSDNILVIEVDDNGVGREKSSQLNKIKKKFESTGMNNIQSRLKLINEMDNVQIGFEIIDKVENDVAQGTIVRLTFPIEA